MLPSLEACIHQKQVSSAYTEGGFRVQGSGFRVQGSGFRVRGAGCRVQGAECRVQGSGCGVQGAGFGVQGAWCRIQCLGCRVQGLVFRVQGSGSRDPGTGYRVQGSGWRVHALNPGSFSELIVHGKKILLFLVLASLNLKSFLCFGGLSSSSGSRPAPRVGTPHPGPGKQS